MYVSTVFDALSKFCLCEGFPVVAKRTAKDARGNVVGPPKNGTVVSQGNNQQIWTYDDVTHICKMAPTPRNTREGHFLALCCA